MADSRILAVVVDCADPYRLATFWEGLVGGTVDTRNDSTDWVALRDVPGLGYLSFQRVPEQKVVKNRLHLDVDTDDLERSIRFALERGGCTIGALVEEDTNWFQVMNDPEGNEFCFILRKNRG